MTPATLRFETLVEMLRHRAATSPGARAYTFLDDGEIESAHLAYGDLHRRARAIAAELQRRGVRPGERAILLFAPGLDFIAGFFGALYAGVVAVPCYPPHPAQVARTLPRVLGIVADARPSLVLTTASLTALASLTGHLAPSLAALPWIAIDALHEADDWRAPAVERATLAFLQYTSGSTSAPRGVMVSHGNLLHNLGYLDWAEENDETSVSVSWLPVIHDMGLIEGVLAPAFGGYASVLMAPAAFLQRPLRWLRAIDRYRATNSGGPNFAYDHCLRKLRPEQRAELDLSSWRVAYNGAEPIRADTLRAFHEAFAPCGFRWRSFYPVYGLAESTLLVSTGRRAYEPVVVHADVASLGAGRVEVSPRPTDPATVRELVSSGPVGHDTTVRIVDPEHFTSCAPGEVGEIWVASASVAQGYWHRDEDTERVFRACIAGEPGRAWLRTGDLGVLRDGELFVIGRIKDLLIVRGVKYHPHDLEHCAVAQHPALRPGFAAAFAIEDRGEEVAAMAAEVDPHALRACGGESTAVLRTIIVAIREAVLREHGVALAAVSLLAAGTIPKTTSGKIRRHVCARAWRDGSLTPVAEFPARAVPPSAPDALLRIGA